MTMRGSPLIALLLQNIDEAYSVKAWHGPNLRGALRGLTAREAARRPRKNRHNIWEIVLHCAYWKYVVRRKILDLQGSFPVKGSNWFPRPDRANESSWKGDLELLSRVHNELRGAVAALSDADLERIPPGSRVPVRTLIYGIAAHDVYHAGQIQLLKLHV